MALVGLSWGGKLALAESLNAPRSVDALILITPGLVPSVGYGALEQVQIASAALVRPGAAFRTPIEPEMFTTTPVWLAFIQDDPLRLRYVTARFLMATRGLDRTIAREAGERRTPALLVLAGRDRIVDNEGARLLLARGPGDLTIVTYPDETHSVQLDDVDRLVADMTAWLEERPMRIVRFERRIVEIPMRVAVEHALAKRKLARNLLLAAVDDGGLVGWGECCPRDYVTGETIETVEAALEHELLPRLQGRSFPSVAAVAEALSAELPESPARPSCRLLRSGAGAARSRRPALQCERRHGPRAGAPAAGPLQRGHRLERRAQGRRHGGRGPARRRHRGQGEDAGRARAQPAAASGHARHHGAGASLRIDANAAWNADEAIRQLDALRPFRLEGCEQPVPGQDFAGMAAVTAAGSCRWWPTSPCAATPMANGSCRNGAAISSICASRRTAACSTRCGSTGSPRRAACAASSAPRSARRASSSAAGRHVATRLPDIVWCEGSYGRILLRPDIVVPDVTVGRGGWAPALDAPGLGVTPDPRLLEQFTTAHRSFG